VQCEMLITQKKTSHFLINLSMSEVLPFSAGMTFVFYGPGLVTRSTSPSYQ